MAGRRRASGALEMLLLSLLSTAGTLSGYQIAAMLADPVSLMWPVKHSQIYPVLALLEEQGDIAGDWVVQTGRPNKKAYMISPSGKARLRDWLLLPRASLTSDEIRLIVYNLHLLGRDPVLAALSTYRRQCVEEKLQLEERWREIWKTPGVGAVEQDRLTGIRSTYEHAVAIRDAQIAWCDHGLKHAEKAVTLMRP